MLQQNTQTRTIDLQLETVGLEVKQGSVEGGLYVFAIDGKTIAKQLGVRRMKWHTGKFKAEDYQRPLDNKRISEIATYLSNNPILPNALVIALEKGRLIFNPFPNQVPGQPRFGGVLLKGKIQEVNGNLESVREDERIGYVIDGQHRLKAIEESTLKEGEFPVVVVAFHGVDARFQLEQFYALNQTVPISPSHLALLRRALGLQLPPKEAHKKAISDVAGILQEFSDSPFQPVKHIRTSIYKGPLAITVLEAMIDRSVKNTNLKFSWKQNADEIPTKDRQHVAKALYVYWKGVAEVFPNYWGKNPKDQRLFCALGLYAMIMFFDKVMDGIDVNSAQAVEQVKKKLEPIKDIRWDKMLRVPATVKTYFRPEHLFDAVNDLWQQQGQRPCRFIIKQPGSAEPLVDMELG